MNSLTTVAIGFLVLLFVCQMYGRLRRDRFRTDIRALRDSLFDYMWQEGHSFDTPAYRETRQTLNGMLRASNWMSLPTMLASVWYSKKHPTSSPLLDAISGLEDEKLRRKLQDAITSAVNRMLWFLCFETAIGRMLLLIYAAAKAIHFLNRLAVSARDQVLELARLTLSDFYAFGSPTFSSDTRRALGC